MHPSLERRRALLAERPSAECPSCGGMGDHGYDESGCRYACYFCGMTGLVTPSARARHDDAMRWATYVEAERRVIDAAELAALCAAERECERFDEMLADEDSSDTYRHWTPSAADAEYDDIPF